MTGIRFLELGVADLHRSRDFYTGLLELPEVADPGGNSSRTSRTCWFDAGPALVKVVEIADGDPGAWRDDDLQGGIRHAGFKTADVDGLVERIAAAGARITAPPRDVLGDVRIAFFLDPDGARLELVQGALTYQQVYAADLSAAEAAGLPRPGDRPRFDHVAFTVPDPEATSTRWARAGYQPIGEIRHHDDPRGFLMTYLGAGGSVLEVFSFDVPASPPPAWDHKRLGLRGVGVAAPAVNTLISASDGLRVELFL